MTELGTVAKITPEFKKRGVKVVAISVDPLDSKNHLAGHHAALSLEELCSPINKAALKSVRKYV